MQSDQTFIQKTFQLINQLTGNVTFISIKVLYLSSTREINISRAIHDIHHTGIQFIQTKGFSLDKSMIFYLDNSKRLFVHVGTFPFPKSFQLLLKFQLFLETTIKLRFRKLSNPSSPKNQKKSITTQYSQLNKPTRKQKTIQQVQQLVSLWRKYFQMTDQNGKKIFTLENAAIKLGIQKKTLDDYYYKLKTAQSLGFDFDKNKNQKIGMLRKFVKQNKMKKNSASNGMPSSPWGSGFFSNKSGQFSGHSVGVANSSYAHSYQQPLPQKPPEDEIDKYFVKDSDQSSSSSDSQQSQ